ncbi:hypothetical protein AX14_010111 [Amanita brunnescens Koide BX004]|nr:hypothetical protein AX14_010111 [Amanita brunnescens Koide BX004]
MRQDNIPDKANTIVQDAMGNLKRSINNVPIIRNKRYIRVMSDWDDEVETI